MTHHRCIAQVNVKSICYNCLGELTPYAENSLEPFIPSPLETDGGELG